MSEPNPPRDDHRLWLMLGIMAAALLLAVASLRVDITIGKAEFVVISLIALVIFFCKFPEVMRSLEKGMRDR